MPLKFDTPWQGYLPLWFIPPLKLLFSVFFPWFYSKQIRAWSVLDSFCKQWILARPNYGNCWGKRSGRNQLPERRQRMQLQTKLLIVESVQTRNMRGWMTVMGLLVKKCVPWTDDRFLCCIHAYLCSVHRRINTKSSGYARWSNTSSNQVIQYIQQSAGTNCKYLAPEFRPFALHPLSIVDGTLHT